MTDDQTERIGCATYTHARRHPMVIGQIGGWTPPFQLSPAQIVVLLVSVVGISQTWRWWGPHLPGALGVLVAIGLPVALTWLVRRGRLEGRSLVRTAVGWLVLSTRPRRGRAAGRAYRPARPRLLRGAPVFVAGGRPQPPRAPQPPQSRRPEPARQRGAA
jgi:hypothetical protein